MKTQKFLSDSKLLNSSVYDYSCYSCQRLLREVLLSNMSISTCTCGTVTEYEMHRQLVVTLVKPFFCLLLLKLYIHIHTSY